MGAEVEAGTYATDLPSASGCGRRVLLELFTDSSYLFVQRYLCKPWSPSQLQTGNWSMQTGELVLWSESGEMRFTMDGESLDYLGRRFGKAGLRLGRAR